MLEKWVEHFRKKLIWQERKFANASFFDPPDECKSLSKMGFFGDVLFEAGNKHLFTSSIIRH